MLTHNSILTFEMLSPTFLINQDYIKLRTRKETFQSNIITHFSFADYYRWLVAYEHPGEEELRKTPKQPLAESRGRNAMAERITCA